MKPSSQNSYTAWIDGLLSAEENAQFEAALSPAALEAARRERSEHEKLGSLLRTHLTAPPMANADFFTHSILQEISRSAPASAAAVPGEGEEARFSWSFFWRLFSASAACAAISILFFVTLTAPREGATPEYYAKFVNPKPAQGISAASFHAAEENVTVLWLDGLDYVPATAMNSHTPSGGNRR